MRVYLSISREDHYGMKCKDVVHLEKEVSWTAPPIRHEIIFFGVDEDGDRGSINATVWNVEWVTDGTITVQARVEFCREGYEAIIQYALRAAIRLAGPIP